ITGYGFEWGSFTWLGSGMWSMLWALWLMPISLGLVWRAIAKGERYGLGVFALLNLRQLVVRIGRGALVGVGSLLIFAWVFVPTLGGLDYVNVNSYQV